MSEELYVQNCPTCDIKFGITKTAEKTWRDSHKSFSYPNGHSMSWQGESSQDVELKGLRAKVKELEEKLKNALELAEKQSARANELALDLEIYKPAVQSEIK